MNARLQRLVGPMALFTASAWGCLCGPAVAADSDEPPPPPATTLVRAVQGGGAQVYACRVSDNGTYRWTLLGPKAVLVADDGSDFGTHAAGPTWTATDGSSVVADGAHPVVKIEHTGRVPSLLLTVTAARGDGLLSGVRFVRRTDTEGGIAPAGGCDASHSGATVAVHYSAVYSFYR